METIRGKAALDLDLNGLNERLNGHDRIILDLGTGDGRYVRSLADSFPAHFIIGVDSCRENLRQVSRAKLTNALFIIASAQDLPRELCGLASQVTINFPWGSLLAGLLNNDASLINGLNFIAQPGASIDLRLNAGALAEAGTTLEAGADRIYRNMAQAGWRIQHPVAIDAHTLRTFPSTWAKRLAFGRDPRAMALTGYLSSPL
jgi:hypothetical protein